MYVCIQIGAEVQRKEPQKYTPPHIHTHMYTRSKFKTKPTNPTGATDKSKLAANTQSIQTRTHTPKTNPSTYRCWGPRKMAAKLSWQMLVTPALFSPTKKMANLRYVAVFLTAWVAKTYRMPYLYRLFSVKEPYYQWLFCRK